LITIAGGLDGARLAAGGGRSGDGAVAVVVDALRSSATLAAMLTAGASEIVVCADVSAARAAAAELGDALLAGEEDNTTPDGFDLGNSPVEAANADLGGRRVVFTSSNGAPIIVAAHGAARILVGGPTNSTLTERAADEALAGGLEVIIIPAMDRGRDCDEDLASAVLLAEVIGPAIAPEQEELAALWRGRIADAGLERLFRESEHGRLLSSLGFDEDLSAAASPDLYPALPEAHTITEIAGATVAVVDNRA
jgi:2-phosphosulfolactate phosphatase